MNTHQNARLTPAGRALLVHRMRDQLQVSRPDLWVFVASRPGDIRADEDWPPVIQREISGADAYCVLLTPNSNGRPWVRFETGAAWMSGKKWVIARSGLSSSEVPLPLSIRPTYSLDDIEVLGRFCELLMQNLSTSHHS